MKRLKEYVAKDIKGYEGVYAITSCGKVYSHSRVNARGQLLKGRWLRAGVSTTGYLIVSLIKNGKAKTHKVHRLVAKHFVEGWFEGAVVNHLDEDKLNNNWDNLEWTTLKKNSQYSLSQTAYFKDPDGNMIKGVGIKQFAKDNGLNPSHMMSINRGNRKTRKGWSKWH